MFTESAEFYDLIYGQFKDYREESERVADLLRRRKPTVETVLDVACGTGEHARHLARSGYSVDGVDIEPAFVELAAAKNPEGRFVCQDMVELDMGRTYDAVLCLFSSIGYALTEERLRGAVQKFADHAVGGGIVVVEPWFRPGDMEDGYLGMHTAETDEIKICRISRTRLIDNVSRIEFDYLVGRREGVERLSEVHELALFTHEQMEQAFQEASLEIEHDPEGLFGRGLYICRKPAGQP